MGTGPKSVGALISNFTTTNNPIQQENLLTLMEQCKNISSQNSRKKFDKKRFRYFFCIQNVRQWIGFHLNFDLRIQ